MFCQSACLARPSSNTMHLVTPLGWLTALVLFLQLPIPLFWFVLHPLMGFWRRYPKASLIVALLLSWPPVTVCIVIFRRELFRSDWPPVWRIISGFALVIFEIWLFAKLTRDLGIARLVGKTELTGGGSIARTGIYARIRHPRYLGSLLAIMGACLLAARLAMWIIAATWTALMLLAISFEEREMCTRFGPAYEEYAREVPRFLPARRHGRR
jgi:protein-S-isoprenylcysteine O-methyltransferase Ste14